MHCCHSTFRRATSPQCSEWFARRNAYLMNSSRTEAWMALPIKARVGISQICRTACRDTDSHLRR
jgi:hypothetical protein